MKRHNYPSGNQIALSNKITPGVLLGLLMLAVMAMPISVSAQSFGGAFEGMSNSKEPIQIEADRLEVFDDKGIALFNGNVSVVQGTTILKTTNLKVWYDRDAETDSPGGSVRQIEATGKVAVRSADQRATADKVVVDMKAQIANLSGNVVVTQGANIITGCNLRINMATNAANLTPCKTTSSKTTDRPKILFTPQSGSKAGKQKTGGGGKKKKAAGDKPAKKTQ